MNSYLLTKILIKEVNEILSEIVAFFKECCNNVNQEENQNENTLEVDGLLLNCLPSHPKNPTCFYKISSDVPEPYLETLFSPLLNEVEDGNFNNDYDLPVAPDTEFDVKKELEDVKLEKKFKTKRQTKGKKEQFCDLCGKYFKTNERYPMALV